MLSGYLTVYAWVEDSSKVSKDVPKAAPAPAPAAKAPVVSLQKVLENQRSCASLQAYAETEYMLVPLTFW